MQPLVQPVHPAIETKARAARSSPAGNPVLGRFGMGSVWSFFGSALPQAASLGSYMVVARLLGKNGFGELGMVQTTAMTLTLISTGSLSVAATKHVSATRTGDPEGTGRTIGIYLLTSIICGFLGFLGLYIYGPSLADRNLNAPQLGPALQLVGLLLFFNTLNGIQVGALLGFEAFRLNALLSVLRGVLLCPSVIGGAYYRGLSGAVLGLIVTSAVCCAVSHSFLRTEARRWGVTIRYRDCASQHGLLWGFSLPAAIGGILVMFVCWLGNAALAQRPNGYGELGIFSAANHWRTAVGFAPAILGQSALPILSELYASGRLAQYRRLVLANLAISAGTSLAVALPAILFSRWIMAAYGAAFASGRSTFVLLVISAVLSACCQALAYTLTSSGRMWRSLGFNTIWALVFLAVLWQGIPRFGGAGLASAYVISYILHAVLIFAYTLRLLREDRQGLAFPGGARLAADLISGPPG